MAPASFVVAPLVDVELTEFPSVVLPVFVMLVNVPSTVAPADEDAVIVLVDDTNALAALDVSWDVPTDLSAVFADFVELLADPFISESVLVVTVVIPVTASLVVEVLVLFTPLSVVTVVIGDEPFSLCIVVFIAMETLPALPSVAVLVELVAPLAVVVLEAVLLLALDVLELTVVVVVVTVVTTSPFEVVCFLVVTDVKFDGGAVLVIEVVPVSVFILTDLPVSITEEIDWPRSDTIAIDWCEQNSGG